VRRAGFSYLWKAFEPWPITRPASQMRSQRPINRGASAGALFLAAILGCAAAGYGLGALVDAAVPLGLAGLFAGLIGGFALVHARFRDL
jgi:hypothetical protein